MLRSSVEKENRLTSGSLLIENFLFEDEIFSDCVIILLRSIHSEKDQKKSLHLFFIHRFVRVKTKKKKVLFYPLKEKINHLSNKVESDKSVVN